MAKGHEIKGWDMSGTNAQRVEARESLGRIVWETSRADESTISVAGANIVADALIAAGFGPVEQMRAERDKAKAALIASEASRAYDASLHRVELMQMRTEAGVAEMRTAAIVAGAE